MAGMTDAPRTLPLHLTWIGVLCGSLLLLLGDVVPVRLTFVRPDTLFLCLLEVQLAFLIFVWPLFVPRIAGPAGRRRALRLLGEGAFLLVLSLPLVLIAANVSNVAAGEIAGSLALLAAFAAFPACLLAKTERAGPWYVLAAMGVSAILPFLRFLGGPAWSWASGLSPFWAAGAGDFLFPTAVYGGLAAVLAGAAGLSRKGMDAPPAPK